MRKVNDFVYELKTDPIDYDLLCREMGKVFYPLHDKYGDQICLTTATGDPTDWTGASGYARTNPMHFNKINASLKNSYINEVIQMFPRYSRWRIMFLGAKKTMSVHRDGGYWDNGEYKYLDNTRIHIPMVTNPQAVLAFFEKKIELDETDSQTFHYAHLKYQHVYMVNTSVLHSAINFGNEPRIHIIAERRGSMED